MLVAVMLVAGCGDDNDEPGPTGDAGVDATIDAARIPEDLSEPDAGSDAGSCAVAADCDDSNPCTVDACGAALTCENTPIPVGMTCGDPDAGRASRYCLGDDVLCAPGPDGGVACDYCGTTPDGTAFLVCRSGRCVTS